MPGQSATKYVARTMLHAEEILLLRKRAHTHLKFGQKGLKFPAANDF